MVLAAWVKKKQFAEGIEVGKKQGIEQGKEIGRSEERKRTNAKLRALGEEYGIPEDKLLIEDEDKED